MDNIIASNGYIGIKKIVHEIDDFIILDNNKQCIVYYNEDVPYFIYNKVKYYLNEFIVTQL